MGFCYARNEPVLAATGSRREMTWVEGPPGGLGVCVDFAARHVVLAVRGELDLLTAPKLGAVLDSVIDGGHGRVVMDLAGVGFMDVAGLRVIAGGADRLRSSGGVLTMQSPSVAVRRVLQVVGWAEFLPAEVVPAEELVVSAGRTGAHPSTSRERPLGRPRPAAAGEGTRQAAGGLDKLVGVASDGVVDGVLRLVVALARATVGGADGVSVSLRRDGRLNTVAASDQTISDMDVCQYATGEGPCIDASVEGHRFYAEALESEGRWPAFTSQARALGINAILSAPLLAGDRAVGALNIYSRTARAFLSKDQELASTFAAQASIVLSEARLDATGDELAWRLGEALVTRQVIDVAQGVIMERRGVHRDEAYTVLRRFSVATGMPLRERAEYIVASAGRGSRGGGPDLGRPSWPLR